ncbi:acetoacetate decarboxylase family protein [Tomitella biformata]|uniref:acetoacetate decarboxylase family protein n=1 Tax=Tomitella biformata TaxID=630403 RepID=UPI000463CBE2|nr:acetoacetate decarboxylase family protein [Tomitella biformata]
MTQEFLIQGEQVRLPVQVRDAETHMAMFSVPIAKAQSVIDYSGLDILAIRPGRAVCALMFIEYKDGDLKQYLEFAVGFMIRPPGSEQSGAVGSGALGDARRLLTGNTGVFVHRLPVTEEFTLEAGRTIWGFPKRLGDIKIQRSAASTRGIVHLDGQLVADLRVAHGVKVPGAGISSALDTYSHLDGVTRRIPWQLNASDTRLRPGGAHLMLGSHPWTDELRHLGLPHSAMFSSSIGHMRMTFEEAAIVAAGAG